MVRCQYATIRAGMQVLPVGGLNAHHESTQFFGVYRPEGEFTIIPSTWHEVALTFMGRTNFGLKYQAMLVPGLDSDRFNRKNWVKPGAGSPYEFKLANTFAGVLRLEYVGVPGLHLGLSGYCGNSFRNTLSKSNVEIDESAYKDVKGMVSMDGKENHPMKRPVWFIVCMCLPVTVSAQHLFEAGLRGGLAAWSARTDYVSARPNLHAKLSRV